MEALDFEEHPFFKKVAFCMPRHYSNCIMESRFQENTDCCYAFVVSSMIYADLAINWGVGVRASEQLLLDCLHVDYQSNVKVERETGTGYPNTIRNALLYTKERRLLLNEDYPWARMRRDCRREHISAESFIVIENYELLLSCDEVVKRLNNFCAVGATIFITRKLKWWKDEIYTLSEKEKREMKEDRRKGAARFHGITLIGHGEEGGNKYFLAQNSWGRTWGFNGFFKVEQSCVKDFYCVHGSKVKHVKLSAEDAAKKKKNKNKKKMAHFQQTDPPSLAVSKLFPSGMFPVVEVQQYKDDNLSRTTLEENRELERQKKPIYNSFRQAAEVHRQVRQYIRQILKPGLLMTDLCDKVEDAVRILIEENGLHAGIAYPTGCSLNWVAANWTPNSGDKTVLKYEDVIKLDFGTQIEGHIVGSAFTVAFNPMFDPLLKASRDATYAGIKEAGIDVRLSDVGAAIQEVMESYEVEIKGKTLQVTCIKDLLGHSIGPYQLYGGKLVPIVKGEDQTKMEEGEVYAIRTFGSTGKGVLKVYDDCSHYVKKINAAQVKPKGTRAKQLFATIEENFSTLPFCNRYLDRLEETHYEMALKSLCNSGILQSLPPLSEKKGSYVSQYEHTILLRPTCKEVVTRGEDY